MSYYAHQLNGRCPAIGRFEHTKDLRYDSKDSREMEKGSFSLSMLRWFDFPPFN